MVIHSDDKAVREAFKEMTGIEYGLQEQGRFGRD
jgi:hypothetical protein